MYSVTYFRKDAEITDIRRFKNLDELNQWLSAMYELREEYYITEIKMLES